MANEVDLKKYHVSQEELDSFLKRTNQSRAPGQIEKAAQKALSDSAKTFLMRSPQEQRKRSATLKGTSTTKENSNQRNLRDLWPSSFSNEKIVVSSPQLITSTSAEPSKKVDAYEKDSKAHLAELENLLALMKTISSGDNKKVQILASQFIEEHSKRLEEMKRLVTKDLHQILHAKDPEFHSLHSKQNNFLKEIKNKIEDFLLAMESILSVLEGEGIKLVEIRCQTEEKTGEKKQEVCDLDKNNLISALKEFLSACEPVRFKQHLNKMQDDIMNDPKGVMEDFAQIKNYFASVHKLTEHYVKTLSSIPKYEVIKSRMFDLKKAQPHQMFLKSSRNKDAQKIDAKSVLNRIPRELGQYKELFDRLCKISNEFLTYCQKNKDLQDNKELYESQSQLALSSDLSYYLEELQVKINSRKSLYIKN